jgi:hypothetical protein
VRETNHGGEDRSLDAPEAAGASDSDPGQVQRDPG